VNILKARFPSCAFFQADISAPDIGLKETFDIVHIFDVLYHIVDDNAFAGAIGISARFVNRRVDTADRHARPGKECRQTYAVPWPRAYRTALDKAGVDIVGLIPHSA